MSVSDQPASAPIATALDDGNRAGGLVSEIIRGWPEDALLDAAAVLDEHPDLNWDRSALLDLAYEEFCQRTEAGQAPDVDAFVTKFPDIQESLRELVRLHATMSRDAAALAEFPTAWPQQGDLFLGFRLTESLGQGAFSRVFRASEEAIGGREVVVKICQRGRAEAQTLGRLEHPHIVPIHSVRTDGETGLTAICMPFVSRATLFDVLGLLQANGVPTRFAGVLERIRSLNAAGENPTQTTRSDCQISYVDGLLHIGCQVAEALHYAHQRGFLHCDIKPSNVLLTGDGGCFVIDFNLAQSRLELTGVGGTVPYMSPEQLGAILDGGAGPIEIDARSDLFSLGVTLYELLAGEPPFGRIPTNVSQQRAAEILLAKQAVGPAPLTKRNPGIDRKLARLIESCLRCDPAGRPQDAAELAKQLRRSLALSPRVRRFARVHRRAALLAGGSALVAASASVYGWASLEPYPIRRLNHAWAAVRQQQWETAIAAFDDAIAAYDNPPLEAYFGRGLAHLRAGNLDQARGDLNRAQDPKALNGVVSACLAECLARSAIRDNDRYKFSDAVALYETVQRQGAATPADLNNLGFCYLHARGRVPDWLRKAVAALSLAHRQDPDSLPTLYNLAAVDRIHAVKLRGKLVVFQHIEQALKLDPTVAETHVDACFLYALATKPDGLPAHQREHYLDRAIEHCAKGAELGIAPKEFVARVVTYLPQDRRHDKRLPPPSMAGRSLDLSVRLADSLDGVNDPRATFLTGRR